MLNTPIITDEQMRAFERDGYLVMRGAFNEDEMALIDTWTRELLARPEESGKHWVFHEVSLKGDCKDLVSRIENIAPFHDGFASPATSNWFSRVRRTTSNAIRMSMPFSWGVSTISVVPSDKVTALE